jgi:N-acetylglucosaminyldiphosphoundecaprenol N-acetyl-beta-D-mannosaminyltransferase
MTFQSNAATTTDLAPPEDDILDLDRRTPARTISFLGLDFSPMDPPTLLARCVEAGGRTDRFRYLITPNVDQIVRTTAQPHLLEINEKAWVNVNDSRILELLAQASGIKLPACPGSDLTAQIFTKAIDASELVVVIGGNQEVIDTLRDRFGLSDLRWHQPPMGLRTNPQAVAEAAQFCIDNKARFYFICVGNPQDALVAMAIKASGQATGLGLCVGASLEFLTGIRQRAPVWMQKMRLEWLFRLVSEPKVLWKRYLVEGPRILGIWLKWRASQRKA